ncbi:MAG: VOC family protein [Microbacteriaceae bacterium]|nr:VOC family protein [Microbacteriaceae bacterium]
MEIFVNLAVNDLPRSIDFYRALGLSFDDRFSDENAACLVIEPGHINAMLLVKHFFSTFTLKPIVDSTVATEVILALSTDSRTEVDAFAERAAAAGAKASNEVNDLGFMYTRSFQDPDGHLWEIFWMDSEAALPNMTEVGNTATGSSTTGTEPANQPTPELTGHSPS